MDTRFILEHAAVNCNTSTLMVLRQLCPYLKHKTDLIICISCHSSIRDELSISRHAYEDARKDFLCLEEGWRLDLTTFDAAIENALSYADPWSWAEYDEESARYLMIQEGKISMFRDDDGEDFANNGDESENEIGWRVKLETWTDCLSRAHVLQVVHRSIRNYRDRNYRDSQYRESPRIRPKSEYSDDTSDKEETTDDVLEIILLRVWGLLLTQPQKLVHVRISCEYQHLYVPAWAFNDYVFIRTSQGKDYLFRRTHMDGMM